jgi:hypothetical protein
MVAELILLRSEQEATRNGAIELGSRLIALTLSIDPILTSDLARLCGPAV